MPQNSMIPGLAGVTYADGIAELAPPFVLYQPRSLTLDVLDMAFPNNPSVPAGQRFTNPEKTDSDVLMFLRAFDFTGNNLILLYNPLTSFRCIIYHELLHACGETPEVRNIRDGAIRHSMIGCDALTELEDEQTSASR